MVTDPTLQVLVMIGAVLFTISIIFAPPQIYASWKHRKGNSMRAWWHRYVLDHKQWQWGVGIPLGAKPVHGERILCQCGRVYNNGRRR